MTQEYVTIVEQFNLVDNIMDTAPHNQAAVREPKHISSDKGDLFVLVEVRGNTTNLEAVEKQVLSLVRDTYYPSSGRVTASLRRAVQAANHWLYQHNASRTAEKRLLAGVVVVALREEDMFVAQVGPTALFTKMGSDIYRYPEVSTWLDQHAEPVESDSALGMYPTLIPEITHLQVAPQDIIVLTDSELAKKLSPQKVVHAVSGGNVETISKNLIRVTNVNNCSVLVIQISTEIEKSKPLVNLVDKLPIKPLAGKQINFSLPSFLSPKKKLDVPQMDDVESTKQSVKHHASESIHLVASTETLSQPTRQERTSDSERMTSVIQTTLTNAWEQFKSLFKWTSSSASVPHATPKPTRIAGRQAPKSSIKQPSQTLLIAVIVGIVAIILFGMSAINWYATYQNEQAYSIAITQAQEKFESSKDVSVQNARIMLVEAEVFLNNAESLNPNQPQVNELRYQISQYRDDINGVKRLLFVPELRTYPESGTQLKRIVMQGVEVYIADIGLGRVFHHTLADVGDSLLPKDGDEILIQHGEQVDDMIVQGLFDVVWMSTGGERQTSDLLIVTRNGLVQYNPTWDDLRAISISDTKDWIFPVSVGSYFGNFYVLDNQANHVFRYMPTPDGYDNPPEDYFDSANQINLNGAVDMAIDSAVYILYQNGTIQKFLGGQPVLFEMTNLDEPLKNPTAIYTAPDELVQYVYVTDAGNQRIIQFTKDGTFVQQFKPAFETGVVFNDLRSIFVDEIGEKMYILNGNVFYAPKLPNPSGDISQAVDF